MTEPVKSAENPALAEPIEIAPGVFKPLRDLTSEEFSAAVDLSIARMEAREAAESSPEPEAERPH
jgi:hypothetical protein